MALPNVHINPTVPTRADSMLVCVCSMATSKMHNRKKVAMHTSLSSMKWFTQNSTPHPPHIPELTFSKYGGLYHLQTVGGNVPLCTGRLRKSFGVEARGKPSSCVALLLLCSLAATKTGGLKKAMV